MTGVQTCALPIYENSVGQRVVMVAVEILERASDDGGDNIGDNVVMMVVEKRTR